MTRKFQFNCSVFPGACPVPVAQHSMKSENLNRESLKRKKTPLLVILNSVYLYRKCCCKIILSCLLKQGAGKAAPLRDRHLY